MEEVYFEEKAIGSLEAVVRLGGARLQLGVSEAGTSSMSGSGTLEHQTLGDLSGQAQASELATVS